MSQVMVQYNEIPRSTPCAPENKPWRKRRPLGIVDHHIVGSLPGCTAHFQNPNTGYATNYGIGSGDGRGGGGWWINEFVPADEVAWGNGNEFLNEFGVSIEHENNLAVAIDAKPVPEVHELSARFMAALAIRFDWRINGKLQFVLRDFPNHDFYGKPVPGFGTEFNVIGHRAVALKDCPHDLDMQWKVNRANEILATGTGELKMEDDNMLIYLPTSDSKDGVIKGGLSYISDGGPLRPLSRAEFGAYDYWNGKDGKAEAAYGYTVKVRWAKWSGDAVRNATRYVGVMEHSSIAVGDVPVLTGRIIYDDPANPTFPRVAASV